MFSIKTNSFLISLLTYKIPPPGTNKLTNILKLN